MVKHRFKVSVKHWLVSVCFYVRANYENLDNPDVTYSEFSTNLDYVINTIYYTVLLRQSESKTRQVSDGEIAGKIYTRGNFYKKI